LPSSHLILSETEYKLLRIGNQILAFLMPISEKSPLRRAGGKKF